MMLESGLTLSPHGKNWFIVTAEFAGTVTSTEAEFYSTR
jgi:hypothetical protein